MFYFVVESLFWLKLLGIGASAFILECGKVHFRLKSYNTFCASSGLVVEP